MLHPPFPGGTEAHLLRATIAAVKADTCLTMNGMFEMGEEEDKMTLVEGEEEAKLEVH